MPKSRLKPLKGKLKVENLLKNGRRFHLREATAIIIFKQSPSQFELINFLVTISKKIAKKAVIRNRVKRLLRESLRQIDKDGISLNCMEQIFLIWKIAPTHPKLIKLNDVLPVVHKLIRKINYFYNKN